MRCMVDHQIRMAAVVIGRNEGPRLVRCLQSLHDGGIATVYVDSGSTDDSLAVARRFGADIVELDMATPFTAARARAEGFDRSSNLYPALDYVLFVDGDCEVDRHWPSIARQYLNNHPKTAVVCGRRRERFASASFYNQRIDAEWDTPVGPALACGGDSVMRVAAYRQVGGFDKSMIAGEEPELCARLRAADWQITRLDAAMTVHDAAMFRFGQWWQRAVRSGFGYIQAWNATRKYAGQSLYRREWQRALFWAGLLPAGSILAALVEPWALLLWPVGTVLQFCRLTMRDGVGSAWLSIIGKYGELLGMARYGWRSIHGTTGGTISYK